MTLNADVMTRLDGFTLESTIAAPAGQITAVLGPNGAGKTTLLRCIAGLTPIDGGSVRVDDAVLEDHAAGVHVAPDRRSVGFVFQDLLLFPHLSALDNVGFPLRAAGMSRNEARSSARGLLAEAGLEGIADLLPHQISGGRRQIVALLRAQARDPEILLLDEPTASIDVVSKPEVRDQVRERIDRFGGIALLVSHDPADALALARRIYVLEEGRVVQAGTASELAREPRTPYVARVFGDER